jgi:heptosyltransferase-2
MKILCINTRKGMGDQIIFLPYIHAISQKFKTPVSLLAKNNSRAKDLLEGDSHVNEIIPLEKEMDGMGGILKLANELKKRSFDKIFIFNSSLRYNLIARLAGIKSIYQYPFSFGKKDNMVISAKIFTEDITEKVVSTEPNLIIKKENNNFDKNFKHVIFGISASGKTKIWDINNYIRLGQEISKKVRCKFYIAAGPNDIDLINKFKNSNIGKNSISFEKLSIKETLPIIKNCDVYIGNDTGFAHISVALKIKSLVIFTDTPIKVYGRYAPAFMSTVEPQGENESIVHNTLGADSISFDEVYNKSIQMLN